MGQELDCTLRYRRRTLAGKAYLETDHLLFRGPERLKILFKDLTAVKSAAGILHLDWPGGPAELDLGKSADKWADKILNPPTRSAKLGLKPGVTARLVGEFDADFLHELSAAAVETKPKSQLIFFSASRAAELSKLPKLTAALPSDGALWVIYPKGVPAIREIEVLEAGRAAGLKDVKVASFSPTHTALKFVIPLAKR